ncbi:patatin-like phospholipase family protein [Pseudotenacibaculum sp. MALMAid0570]|uniref:patatin-like phospholipase family protein n=1 Tax=Pseudotenacibaculum sp. MALMAid0570 TaxID=3143938 RepID=UPI0032DE8377
MSENTIEKQSLQPFETIGLCFSGGGYRATFFAFGVISYLQQAKYKDNPLLSSVRALSTVSGGTLTGVGYTKALQEENYNFYKFFKTFYNTFTPENDKLLHTAVAKLIDDQVWKDHPYKKRSLINAFALAYQDLDVFKGDFSSIQKDNIKQLKKVSFNATDFSFGLTYRFQNVGYFGNNPLYRSNQKEINVLRPLVKFGDVIASSSCFPVGFEPLVFPDDYFEDHQSVEYQNLKKLDDFVDGVGIMDGGITDNQGIGSMLNINRELKLDLIIVCDVSSYKMDPWEPEKAEVKDSSSIQKLLGRFMKSVAFRPIYWITILLGLFLILYNLFFEIGNTWNIVLKIVGSLLLTVGLLFSIVSLGISSIVNFASKKLKALFKKKVPKDLSKQILLFKKLDISLVKRMLVERATSSMKMISDVFLKQIRRINYQFFYYKDSLKHRRITATVYRLNGLETPYSTKNLDYNEQIQPAPSKSLQKVALTASQTPTTLWWDDEDIKKKRMDTLIACGQFTICYELMNYIIKLKADKDSGITDFTEIDKLYDGLQSDWTAFNDKPMWLVDELKK